MELELGEFETEYTQLTDLKGNGKDPEGKNHSGFSVLLSSSFSSSSISEVWLSARAVLSWGAGLFCRLIVL